MGTWGGWVRRVRLAAAAAVAGLPAALPLAAFGAAAKAKEPEGPSYVLCYLAAGGMCIIVLLIACTRYRRT